MRRLLLLLSVMDYAPLFVAVQVSDTTVGDSSNEADAIVF